MGVWMERGRVWRTAFKTSLGLMERNFAGYTDEIAARRPMPGVSSPAWLLGHVLGARGAILRLMGAPQAPDPELGTEIRRGGDGETVGLPFSELMRRFQASDEAMKQACLAVTDWDAPVKNPGLGIEQPLEQAVAFMYMHECYHLGQIGYARKLLGLMGQV